MANLLGKDDSGTKETEEGPAKKTLILSGDKEMQEQLDEGTRMNLSAELGLRVVKAACLETFRLRSDGAVMQAIKESTAQYIKRQREMIEQSRDHQQLLGPIHGHQFNAALGALIRAAKDDEKKILEALVPLIVDIHYLAGEVKQFRTSNMHESKFKRLEVRLERRQQELMIVDVEIRQQEAPLISPATVWPTMRKILLREPSAREMPGMAPAGSNARNAQRRLDKK